MGGGAREPVRDPAQRDPRGDGPREARDARHRRAGGAAGDRGLPGVGLTLANNQLWNQANIFTGEDIANGDQFGFALAAVGIMFLFGRMNMAFAVSICVGLVILFGAATILGGFA